MKKGLNMRQLAERWGCCIDTPRKHVENGDLRAVNIATGKKRARWIVPLAEVEAFESRRSNQRPATKTRQPASPTPKRQWV